MLGEAERAGRLKYTVYPDQQYVIHIVNPAAFTSPAEASAVVSCKCGEHVEVKLDRISICPKCGQEFGIDVEFKVWYEHKYDPFNPGP